MNQEIKAKWVEALRSGEYKQCIGRLKNDHGEFCCLGVLCDIRFKEFKDSFSINPQFPDEATVQWADLDFNDPIIEYKGVEVGISNLNDLGALSFPEIADLIEAQL